VGDRRKRLEGTEATAENILRQCQNLELRNNDSVFVFYCGHGGTVKDRGHCLLPQASRDEEGKLIPGQPLPRNDVVNALMQKNPRFICFVTDACAGEVKAEFPTPTAYQSEAGKISRPVIVEVMLTNTGVFDVNSATPPKGPEETGQQAIILPTGGLFTKVFTRLAADNHGDLDGDGKVKWKAEFYPLLQKETSRAFKKLKSNPNVDLGIFQGQDDQVPERFDHEGTATLGAAAPPAGAAPAGIRVTLPADAVLTFDGTPTRSTGGEREFVTPPLAGGKTYTYTLQASRVRDGKTESVTQQVKVRAGEVTPVEVTFQAAAVAAR
jgi:uncharacterized protein (TIGR03000 family)